MTATPPPAPSIVLVRTIAAPVADVFAAWTDPALLRQWLAPYPMEVVEASADVRPGGSYRIVVAGPDGVRHTTTGEYREVVSGRRLVKTWIYEAPDPAVPRSASLLTVEFRDAGSGTTELTLRHDGLPTVQDRVGSGTGWLMCLEKLDVLVSREKQAA